MLKKIKEDVLNKEMTIGELDDKMTELTDSSVTLYDGYNKSDWQQEEDLGSFAWGYDEETGSKGKYNVEFDILEQNEDEYKTLIKVIDVEEIL